MISDGFRRIYNTVEVFFDRHAINQELHFSHDGGKSARPKTALQVYQSIQSMVYDLDRQAQLKLIVSPQGINSDGASAHWEFFFDLIQRRAHLVCEWTQSWDEAIDDFGPARIEITAKPFPPVDNPIRQLVASGKLLHRQMVGMWKQECLRTPNLPKKFRDTDTIITEFLEQGLDVIQNEFSLNTGLSPEGRISWIARTRNTAFYAKFI